MNAVNNMHVYDETTRELALSDGRIMMIPASWLDENRDPLDSVQDHASKVGLIKENDLFVSLR